MNATDAPVPRNSSTGDGTLIQLWIPDPVAASGVLTTLIQTYGLMERPELLEWHHRDDWIVEVGPYNVERKHGGSQ